MRYKKISAMIVFTIGIIFAQENLYESRQNAITNAIKKISPAVASINVVQLREYQVPLQES